MRQLFSAFLIFFFLQTTAQDNSARIALLVAVGNYPASTGWRTISSPHDIPYLRAALESQGFAEKDIDTLVDAQATKAGILRALDRLIARATPGAVVVFHFSGHGQQIFDEAPKDEADGYDEALVPYDANMRYGNGYTGQNHLRDDELGLKLKALRSKIGPSGSLLVLLDACHSGTATRGEPVGITRGTDEKCEPPGYAATLSGSRGAGEEEGMVDDKDMLSNMVVISAAAADQLNYETRDAAQQGVGSLSYAFSLALAGLHGPVSCQQLYEKIRASIQSWKPFQDPQIEGNTRQQLLGGKLLAQPDIIRIQRWNPDGTVLLPRGRLQGWEQGALFKVFRVDQAPNDSAAVATGELIAAGMGSSTGRLSTNTLDKSQAYRVLMDGQVMGDMSLQMKIDLADTAISAALRRQLADLSFLRFSQQGSDLALGREEAEGRSRMRLRSGNDRLIWEGDWPESGMLPAAEAQTLQASLKQFSRARFLRGLGLPEGPGPFPYVSVDIIPGTVVSRQGKDTLIERRTLDDIRLPGGGIAFAEADDQQASNPGFVIRVRNLENFPVFLSVIDIQPDDQVNLTIPDPSDPYTTAEDYKVMPRQVFETRPIKLYPPYGAEFMKVLLSREAMDLRGIESGKASRGTESSFEKMFRESLEADGAGRSRGTHLSPVKVDEIRIVPFSFEIQARKSLP